MRPKEVRNLGQVPKPAGGLGLRVCAEAYDLLTHLGCTEGQGYWMARPMAVADFET
jgi:predicted signal transduction protein with EAL and GGDEF domain